MAIFSVDKSRNRNAFGMGALLGGAGGIGTGATIGGAIGMAVGGPPGAAIGTGIGAGIAALGGAIGGGAISAGADKKEQKDEFDNERADKAQKQAAEIDNRAIARASKAPKAASAFMGTESGGTDYDSWKRGF